MKATDETATYKQNQFSKHENTKVGGSSEEPKIAPGGVVRLTDSSGQVTGNPKCSNCTNILILVCTCK